MYEIAYFMMIEFIDNLAWIIPMFLVFGFIGSLIRSI